MVVIGGCWLGGFGRSGESGKDEGVDELVWL